MKTPPALPGITSPCTGCGLCASICPRGCITMKESETGFLIPEIDTERCTGCGVCRKLCAKQETTPFTNQRSQCYEFVITDTQKRFSASSGGFCTELARQIILKGGVVFGVALQSDFRARYIEIRNENELWKLQGSKYIQANTDNCFRHIALRLKENKTVLFIGTTCQVRALKTRFPQPSPHLISVDIACYGVPSYLLLDAYLRELNNGTDKIKHLYFKNKSRGWRNNSLHLIYESGREIISPAGSNPFIQGFDSRLCLNAACYCCSRNSNERFSDITCADYWGHKDKEGDNSHLGISCIICHTTKGEKLVKRLEEAAEITPISLQEATKRNGGLITKNESVPSDRSEILSLLQHSHITPVIRRYMYSQGGKRISARILGIKIQLPEFAYNLLRNAVRRIRRK